MQNDSEQAGSQCPACPEGLESLSSGICCIVGLSLVALASMSLEPQLPVVRGVLACFVAPAAFLLWAACFGTQRLKRRVVTVLGACVAVVGGCELALQRLTGTQEYSTVPSLPDADGVPLQVTQGRHVSAAAVPGSRLVTSAEIVTLSTAPTEGAHVDPDDAWPSQLGRLLQCSVSNLEISEFGSPHDEVLLQQAMSLQPRLLVVALNPISDLNVIRFGHPSGIPSGTNSVGALIRQKSALGRIGWQLIRRAGLDSRQMIRVDHPTNPTLFSSESLRAAESAVNLEYSSVGRAVNQTICFLQRAQLACRAADCELLVLLIPSRARIYREHLLTILDEIPPPIERTVAKELRLLRMLRDTLHACRITCSDAGGTVLEQMQGTSGVYPSWNDNKPMAAGHKAYARAVYATARPMLTPPEFAPPELATN